MEAITWHAVSVNGPGKTSTGQVRNLKQVGLRRPADRLYVQASALLPPKRRVHRGRSHAGLPFPELPALITEMRAARGMPTLASRFAILTGGRSRAAAAEQLVDGPR